MAAPVAPLPPAPLPAPAPAPRSQFSWTAVGVVGGLGLYGYYLWLWVVHGEAVGAAILLAPILVGITLPIFLRAYRSAPGFDLAGIMLVGLVMRFAFTFHRYTHAVDAMEYHVEGIRLSRAYRNLDFAVATGKDVPGTGGMRAIAGVIEIFANEDYFAAFVIATWMSFLGCYLIYRAFSIAVDGGDRRRYALLVFLWPSMAFWPASLGKDAWMLLTVGVAAYGAARVFKRLPGGYLCFAAGLLGASFVRPHLALLALMAFFVALLVGRRQTDRNTVTPASVGKVMGLVIVLVIGSILVSRTQSLLGLEDFSASSIQSASEQVTNQTSVGSSTYAAPNPRSPNGFVIAAVTVLFRPFPFEASGGEQLFTALEGLALAAITALSFRRLWSLPRRWRAQPYTMFATAYVLLWILAFGVIANFGILARQRTQMLPFYFVLLCVPPAVARVRKSMAATRATPG